MQTKKHSLFESLTNIAVGIGIALPAQYFYFYMFDIEVTTSHNLGLAAWMTVISLLRSYSLRRYFNKKTGQTARNVN